MEQQTQTPAESKPELVPLHEASDADVDEAVKNNPLPKQDGAYEEDEPVEVPSDADAETVNEQDGQEATEEDTKAEEAKESDQQDDAKKEESKPEPERDLQDENEQLRERVEQQERFIQQRNTQFGEVRKELRQIRASLQEGLKEKAEVDPAQAIEDKLNIEKIDRKLEEIDSQQSVMNHVHETQKIVLAHVKPSEVPFTEIVETLKSEGVNGEWLRNFEQNPYAAQVTTADFVIQLHRRVRAEGLLKKVVAAYKKLEAKGKTSEKPTKTETVLKAVEKAISSGPSVTAAAGGGASKETYDIDPTQLSDSELDNLLKKYARKRR